MNGISQLGGYGGQSLMPQGLFGGLFGAPLGGMIGRGIGGLFGNAGLGGQIGQMAGGIGGGLLPFQSDPMLQAYLQQSMQPSTQGQMPSPVQQLAPQGWVGNLIGQYGQPAGSAIGGLFGQSGLGGQIGGIAGQLGRLLPFQQDPISQAYAQLAQQMQQLQQQMQQLQQLQQVHQWQGQQGQQSQAGQQFAPQGFFGNLLGQIGQPLGGVIGGLFGQSGLGSQIGGAAGQLGRLLPFQMDPSQQQAWSQLQQSAPYASAQQMPYGGGQATLH